MRCIMLILSYFYYLVLNKIRCAYCELKPLDFKIPYVLQKRRFHTRINIFILGKIKVFF